MHGVHTEYYYCLSSCKTSLIAAAGNSCPIPPCLLHWYPLGKYSAGTLSPISPAPGETFLWGDKTRDSRLRPRYDG